MLINFLDILNNAFDNIFFLSFLGIISILLFYCKDYYDYFFHKHKILLVIYYIIMSLLFVTGILFTSVIVVALLYGIILAIYYPTTFTFIFIGDVITGENYTVLDEEDDNITDNVKYLRMKLYLRYAKREISKLQIIRFILYLILFVGFIVLGTGAYTVFNGTYKILWLLFFIIIFLSFFSVKSKEEGFLINLLKEYCEDVGEKIEYIRREKEYAKSEIKRIRLSSRT